ncbi:unnamed protein product [Penicillium camemberti]|uniref:Str. FM013 n=1 Tax=Penicillium camemberti (strain FM 013) TaxID=1429867 RepID=A0A0G4PLU6_PENC3|nr:unnamed protein product [Penicillium camemberti]
MGVAVLFFDRPRRGAYDLREEIHLVSHEERLLKLDETSSV